MRNYIIVFLLMLTSFIAGGWLLGEDDSAADAQGAKQETVKRVRVATATQGARNQMLHFPGATRAVDRASLTFIVSGTIGVLPVEIGDEVAAGQVLATIYNPQLEPQMNAAKSRVKEVTTRLSQVKKDLANVQALFESGAATQDELDQTRSAYRGLQASQAAAKAQLAEAQQLLEQAQIKAPFAGTVDRIYFERGEFVPAGRPVIELNGGNALEVEIHVPESLIGHLALNQTVSVEFPFLDDLIVQGRISELGRGTRQLGQLFPVVVVLPETSGLRAGLTAELVFNVQAEAGLQVPVQAVVDPGSGNARVFKLVDGIAYRVPVKVVSVAGSSVVVQGDLAANDHVVIAGQRALTDGEAVEILQ